MSHDVPVVYIAGCSYSGTTMLGTVLGADPTTFFAGEINQFMRRSNPALSQSHGHHFCTCGERYENCVLWGAVHSRTPAVADLNPTPGFSRDNLRMLLRLLTSPPASHVAPPAGETEYGTLVASIQHALGQVDPRAHRIVDSSKSIRSLDALLRSMRSSNATPRVVHIVRNGEAVASSYKRRGAGVYYGMSAWALVNVFLRFYLRRRKIPNLKIDYRSLCERPERELARIDAFLGTELSRGNLAERVRATDYHMFAGNKGIRGVTAEFAGIELRDDCSALSPFERAVAVVFLRPIHRLLQMGAS